MTEDREGAEREEARERGDAPFDDNPPVDPTSQQVGNSNARFFMPREEGQEGDDEAEQEEEGEADG